MGGSRVFERKGAVLTFMTTILGFVSLLVIVVVIATILSWVTQGSSELALARSVSTIATSIEEVCKNDRSAVQLDISVPKEKSIYILNCEQVSSISTIPQHSKWWSDSVQQKQVSWYKGWEDIIVDCSKVSLGSAKRRVHIALFEIDYKTASAGNTIIVPKVSSAKVNCALHDLELLPGEGELFGGTKRKVEIGVSPEGTVYARSGGEVTIA